MYKVVLGFLQLILSQFMSIIQKDVLYFEFVAVNVLVTNSVFVAYCLYKKTGISWVTEMVDSSGLVNGTTDLTAKAFKRF